MLKSVGSKTKTLKTKALGPNTKTKTHYKNEETLRKRRPVLRKLHLERIQKNVVCLKVLELHKFASIHSWVICFAASLRSWRYCWRARSKVLAKYEILSLKLYFARSNNTASYAGYFAAGILKPIRKNYSDCLLRNCYMLGSFGKGASARPDTREQRISSVVM